MGCDGASSIPRRGRQPGFTLLELLIVMAILAIVAGTAVPPMQAAARATRLEGATQALIGDLRLARIEAIRRNVSIEVSLITNSTYAIENVGMRTLKDGVTFESGTGTLRFAPFGPVETGMATYVLQLDDRMSTVRVSTAGNASAE